MSDLHAALERYGKHDARCIRIGQLEYEAGRCVCGLEQALAAAPASSRFLDLEHCPAATHHRVKRYRAGSKIVAWHEDGPEVEPTTLESDICTACGYDFLRREPEVNR